MAGEIFQIKLAERKAIPVLICLWGPPGSGKTYSALKVARGLVGPNGKIGVIDTENKRAEFYATIGEPWDHLDFQPPFSPERYIEALDNFEETGGYDCIIVDSMSHVWEGEGGILDMANNNDKKGLAKWNAPKMAYKRMLNKLLRAPFHVIFCLRAKEGVRQTGRGQDMEIESVGLEPICEKNFIYEMTVSALLGPDHRPLFKPMDRFSCNPMIPSVKAPDEIWGAIKPNEYLNEATGEAIADWVNGGAEIDKALEKLKRVANDVATMGTEKLKLHWKSLSKAEQKLLKSSMEKLKATAAEADEENKPESSDQDDDSDPFADEFTNNESEAA